jgi:hypothetical protein
MFPVWMKAFGDGEPLKPQPANADEQIAANAADKVVPATPRRDMCQLPRMSDTTENGRLSYDSLPPVKVCGNVQLRRAKPPRSWSGKGAEVSSSDTQWPPNHRLVSIDVLGITDPVGGPITVSIDGVFQDEPVNGKGDGNTSPDAEGIGTGAASVRAERAGKGNGRVYTVFFTASNDGGSQCNGSATVGVPKNPESSADYLQA